MSSNSVTVHLTDRECNLVVAALRCFQWLYGQSSDSSVMRHDELERALKIAKRRAPLITNDYLEDLCERISRSASEVRAIKPDKLDRFIGIAVDSEEGQFSIDYIAARSLQEANEVLGLMRSYSCDCEAYSLTDWAKIAETCTDWSIEEIQAKTRHLVYMYGESSNATLPASLLDD